MSARGLVQLISLEIGDIFDTFLVNSGVRSLKLANAVASVCQLALHFIDRVLKAVYFMEDFVSGRASSRSPGFKRNFAGFGCAAL